MTPLVFFGSSPFSVTVMEKLLSQLDPQHYPLTAVVTSPDRPAGRGLHLAPNPVKLFAQKHHLPVVEKIAAAQLDLPPKPIGLVAAFGQIIPPLLLNKFNNQIFNIHPSLLPKYRGPSPLQQQLLDGLTTTGATLFQLDSQMDHGPIVAQVPDTIRPDDTWLTLGQRLFSLGADLFIHHLTSNRLQPTTLQNHRLATTTRKLTRQDGFIKFSKLKNYLDSQKYALEIETKFRAFHSWPGIWSIDPSGRRLKLVSLAPPTIQLPGRKPTPWASLPPSSPPLPPQKTSPHTPDG